MDPAGICYLCKNMSDNLTQNYNSIEMSLKGDLQISQRGIDMPASPIRKLAPLSYAAEDRGVKIYRLNIGQPDLPTPQKALEQYNANK